MYSLFQSIEDWAERVTRIRIMTNLSSALMQ